MRPAHSFLLQALVADRNGSTAVEFALVAIALCTVLYGSMEFCRLVWTQSALNFAVQEAARCASVTPATCGTSAQITTYAANEIAPNYVPASAFTASTSTCGHLVSASFVYPFVVKGLMPSAPTLAAAACFP